MRTEHMEKNILEQASLATHTLSVIKGVIPVPQHITYLSNIKLTLICIWVHLAFFPIIWSVMNNKHGSNQISQLFSSVG